MKACFEKFGRTSKSNSALLYLGMNFETYFIYRCRAQNIKKNVAFAEWLLESIYVLRYRFYYYSGNSIGIIIFYIIHSIMYFLHRNSFVPVVSV